MILTNRSRLPEPIFRAVANDPYSSGDADISTTRLISPPQIVALTKRYAETVTEDAVDRLYALQGQIMHLILERAAGDNGYSEKRVTTEIGGWKVSGAIDLIENDELIDFKYTTVWSWVYGPKKEWVDQSNVNRFLAAKNGIEVRGLKNILMFRDWSKRDHRSAKEKGRKYPADKVVSVELPLWTMEEAQIYIEDRVAAHRAAQGLPDDKLPPCSDEDRWKNNVRCATYCGVVSRCAQAQAMGIIEDE